MSRTDAMIRAAAGVTAVGLAGIAGAISYSHMAHLAHAHGESGWRGHLFPLSVDGIEIVASLVLLADRRAGRRSGFLPWAALIAGTGASLAANVAVGGSDWIGRAVSGWPAFALLTAIKLLFGLLDHPTGRPEAETPVGTLPDRARDRSNQPGTVPVMTDRATIGWDGGGRNRQQAFLVLRLDGHIAFDGSDQRKSHNASSALQDLAAVRVVLLIIKQASKRSWDPQAVAKCSHCADARLLALTVHQPRDVRL